jgi:hypothetical protein
MINIKIGDMFTVSKTELKFVEVLFTYPDGSVWDGCFPMYYSPMSIQFDLHQIEQQLPNIYKYMSPESIINSTDKTRERWPKLTTSETYKVFESLLSGRWVCRSCGAGKINDQAAARIRDIKKNGFIVATKNKTCVTCSKAQCHDILLVFEVHSETRLEFRMPLSKETRKKIIKTLNNKDVFFDAIRPDNEFVIDHKFPSQRWQEKETKNEELTPQEIKDKFQLLTNQTNMLKSRLCDSCCNTGLRPDFLGIKWFYSGTEQWVQNHTIENGCNGCPWFDLKEWKNKISTQLVANGK